MPQERRHALRTNQRDGYGALLQAAAGAIIELARDRRFVGGNGWRAGRPPHLDPAAALPPACPLFGHLWRKPWIVHITAWGAGEQAVLDYLARYVFRVAVTNARLVGLDDNAVRIRYKRRKSARWRTCPIAGEEFMRRFLQHVLPKGFHKLRYFGLWHPANRELAARVRLRLALDQPQPPAPPGAEDVAATNADPAAGARGSGQTPACPHCQTGHLVLIRRLTPRNPMAP